MSSNAQSMADKRAAMVAGETSSYCLFRCSECGHEQWMDSSFGHRPICPECFDGWDTPNARMCGPERLYE